MSVTIATDTRQGIKTAISAKFGSLSAYCAKRGMPYSTVQHLLLGRLSAKNHADIIEQVKKDVGADFAAWGR